MKNRLLTIASATALAALTGITLAANNLPAPTASTTPALTAEQSQFFESKIRPILAANCYKCHSAEQGKAKGGLTLDTRQGLLKGG
jgi:uncharacterized membrane protein